jgi:predicted transcriptional regulator
MKDRGDDDDDSATAADMGMACPVIFLIPLVIVIVIIIVILLLYQRQQNIKGKRKEVLEYIRQNPGANFNKIKNSTESGAGSTDYNLRKLQEQQMIHSKEDGQYKRFYDSSVPFKGAPADAEASTKEKVYRLIKDNPEGVTSTEVMEALGVSKQVAFYNLNLLLGEKKVVTKEVENKQYFALAPEPDE